MIYFFMSLLLVKISVCSFKESCINAVHSLFNVLLLHCKVTAGTSRLGLAGVAKRKIDTLKPVLQPLEKCR